MKHSVTYGRTVYIVCGFIPATVFWLYGPPDNLAASKFALQVLGTLLAILTGFMILLLTLWGNMDGIYKGSWRTAHRHGNQLKLYITRITVLFYVYLLTLFAIFIATALAGYLEPD